MDVENDKVAKKKIHWYARQFNWETIRRVQSDVLVNQTRTLRW